MKKIKKLKTGIVSRNLSMLKMASKFGKDFYFSKKEELSEKITEGLSGKLDFLASELGELKGSFLKAGQMLSLYAGDIFPPEFSKVLQELQGTTSYLDWKQISKQIPAHILESLEIEEEAMAAASIGQVHKARDKSNQVYALKIQYRNVEKLIDADLKALRLLLKFLKIIPKGYDFDQVFSEVKQMMLQEMDYEKEAYFTQKFYELASLEFIVPKVALEFSSKKVLCLEYIEANNLQASLHHLTQEIRDKLAQEFFLLFLKEIYEWKLLQSDAHPGNYLIKDNKWVLLDFGAVKELSSELQHFYTHMIYYLFTRNREKLFKLIDEMGAINLEKSNLDILWNHFLLVSAPLFEEDFNWESSEISQQVLNRSKLLQEEIVINFIPHENIFIDRKIAGVYYMFKMLRTRFNISKFYHDYLDSIGFKA